MFRLGRGRERPPDRHHIERCAGESGEHTDRRGDIPLARSENRTVGADSVGGIERELTVEISPQAMRTAGVSVAQRPRP